ncbi:hypothetical protein [Actinoplanes xinjiangensis]|uniref:hypothetical protein n=1 Tax=Actinoplanes xinjiangensis TaxID=512350 RepID=UPI0034281A86
MRLLPVMISAIAAGSLLAPTAAHAAIRFDPSTNTGFIDGEDVRKAFGWDEARLARNAPEIGFTYHVGKEAAYSVVCGRGVRATAGHNPGSTSTGLEAVVAGDPTGGGPTGFRLIGARSGASSMDIAPEPGLPCPDERGGTIRRVRHLSTTVTTGLSAEFRDEQVYFPQMRTVSTEPPASAAPAAHTAGPPASAAPAAYSAVSRTAWANASERCSKLRKRP